MKTLLRSLAVCVISTLIITFPVKKEPPKPIVKASDNLQAKLNSIFKEDTVVTDVKKEEVKPTASVAVAVVEAPKPVEEPKPEPVPAPQPEPVVVAPTPAPEPVITGTKTDWMRAAGIPVNDWPAVDFIVTHESTWYTFATNPTSGAYGLCQSLPGNKMASAGSDWGTNPVTQLKWCHSYALGRYGSWWSAMAFWQANRWW